MAESDKVDLKKDGGSGPKETVTEVWTLVRDYAKQETVDPLKGLLGFTKWGLAGAVLIGIGVIELLVAVLRVTQTEAGAECTTEPGAPCADGLLDGRWSFVPYVVTLVVVAVVVWLMRRAPWGTSGTRWPAWSAAGPPSPRRG